MSTEENAPESAPTPRYTLIEDEDVCEEGFLIISTDAAMGQYASRGPNELFTSRDEATDAMTKIHVKGGVPIGKLQVVEAKLLHRRMLGIVKPQAAVTPNLIITP